MAVSEPKTDSYKPPGLFFASDKTAPFDQHFVETGRRFTPSSNKINTPIGEIVVSFVHSNTRLLVSRGGRFN
jgi:hypothetical protein